MIFWLLILQGVIWLVMAADQHMKKDWDWFRSSLTNASIWFAAATVISALK